MNSESTSEANIQRGLILLQQERYKEAEEFFRNALASDPQNARAMHHLAICQANQSENKITALETIDLAIALQPEESDFHATKAHFLVDLDRNDDAIISANKAVKLDPDNVYALNAKASVHVALREWANVEQTARQALSIDADDSTAANLLAHSLRLQNKLRENADQIQGMLARDPEDAFTHANAGWAALQNGDKNKAEEHFLEALRIDPGLEHAREGLLESFKARSPLYRMYLNYCFFLQRFSKRMRWAIFIGIYLGFRFAHKLFTSEFVWIGTSIAVLYLLLALWVHFARGVGNLLVLIDSFARHALSSRQRREALGVGGGVTLGVILLVIGVFSRMTAASVAGITLICTALPLAYTFTNNAPVGKWMFGGFAVFITMTGLLSMINVFIPKIVSASLLDPAVLLSIIMAVSTTWICGISKLNR